MLAARLDAEIKKVCPIYGVSILGPRQARPDYQESATATQKAAALTVVAEIDWSEAADAAWLASQNPEKKELVDSADKDISDNNGYLALPNSQAQQMPALLAHIRRLTEQVNRNTKLLKKLG